MNTHQIDWSQCETRMIDSGVNDLPRNIVSVPVEELTPAVLRETVHFFETPVQVVQFETPEDKNLHDTAKLYAEVEGEEPTFGATNASFIRQFMREYFCQLASESPAYEGFHAIGRQLSVLLKNVIDVFGEQAVNEVFILRDDAYHEYPSFHSHISDDKMTKEGEKAFFLTRPLSQLNTVFVNSCDIDNASRQQDAIDVTFNNSCPVIWSAKPGSTLLFATKGHEQGPCFHATPAGGGKRVIPIVNFKIGALTHT